MTLHDRTVVGYHVSVVTIHPDRETADRFYEFLGEGHINRFLTDVPGVIPRARVVRVDSNPDKLPQIEIHYQFGDKSLFDNYVKSDFASQFRGELKSFIDQGVKVSRVTGLVSTILRE